jgi:hypothetical protein
MVDPVLAAFLGPGQHFVRPVGNRLHVIGIEGTVDDQETVIAKGLKVFVGQN